MDPHASTEQTWREFVIDDACGRAPDLSGRSRTPQIALRPAQRWLNRLWPSTRLGHDPLSDWCVQGRYVPVSIANWKLTPMMRHRILECRVAQPLSFTSTQRLTIVIPFRDRETHLRQLLPILTPMLREQGIRYRIIVVEQERGQLFNRGRLINAGIHFTADASDYYCLHDVDALPLLANYACPSQPLRLVRWIADHRAELLPDSQRSKHYFSGAVSVRKEQVFAANGYSNEYWGWGGEDDDFFFRLLLRGMLCYYDTQGRFLDLPNPAHQQARRDARTLPPHWKRNRRRRSRLVRGLLDPAQDGLSTLRYEVIDHRGHGDHERLRVRW